MKEKYKVINRLDALGISASLLCAIHCALLPLILTISSLSSLAWLESPWLEITFIAASVIIASYSLTRSYLKHHHVFKAITIVTAGFTLIIFSRFLEHGFLEHIVTALGGLTVAYAHFVNLQLMKNCHSCEEECHN